MGIKFGTSGWRAIMGDEFTFPRVRICVQAIADQIFKEKLQHKPFIVGYDTRFLSEQFAQEAARILANNGIEVLLSDRDVPTPVVAFQILKNEAGGAINITASHNPYDYNGIKYSTAWGGPALPEVTQLIEGAARSMSEDDVAKDRPGHAGELAHKLIRPTNFVPAYIKQIKSLLDHSAFKGKKLKIVVDALYGTSRGYLAEILRDLGCDVTVLHEYRDVLFGGKGPDPSPKVLTELIEEVKKSKAHLGLACDGDSDRFAIVDQGGIILSPNDVFAPLLRYLIESREYEGIVARSVMTTHAIDAVSRQFGLEIKETPVGFKHIGQIMKEAESIWPSSEGEFIMGAEESGGFTVRGHIPEKDGILACLLVAEMVAQKKASVSKLIEENNKAVGVRLSRRINLKATPELVRGLRERFSSKPPLNINGINVQRIVDIDGFKFIFHGGAWLGVRFSGTEPVIRIYLEGDSDSQLDTLQAAGESLLHLVSANGSGSKATAGSAS